MKADIPSIPNGFTLITDLPVPGVASNPQVRVLYNMGAHTFERERDLPYLEPGSESYLLRVSFVDMGFMLEAMGRQTRSIRARLFGGVIFDWIGLKQPLVPPREFL